MYACSNVIQEKLVKHKDREEYLGMLGLVGSILAGCQVAVMEGAPLSQLNWSAENLCFMSGFVICLNLMYSRASAYLKHSDAAYLNLSLLTSDVYAVIFSFCVYGFLVPWLYFLAFSFASIGLVVYSLADSPTAEMSQQSKDSCTEAPVVSQQHILYCYHSLPSDLTVTVEKQLVVDETDSVFHPFSSV
jgi:solute carrier family 35 protein F1/2